MKVFSYGNGYLVMEKINTNKVYNELNKLNNIKKHINDNLIDSIKYLKSSTCENIKKYLLFFENLLKFQNNNDFINYCKLNNKNIPKTLQINTLDIILYPNNYGYDNNNNNLKLFDY